ncbi:MAG: hypothetical protein KKH52_03950 [Nanoarchaeota archaeon]|nr:hypothetical protein [Nanoarchaeota archaeon]MBU1622951.1 hypothetical protein [Nanoarchaeota archaeon]MBU1974522.1 hypothetical protein [Nanoarchaeota archaeon]
MNLSNSKQDSIKEVYRLAKEGEIVKAKRIIRKILDNGKRDRQKLDSHLKIYYQKLNESLEIDDDRTFEYKVAAALDILQNRINTDLKKRKQRGVK